MPPANPRAAILDVAAQPDGDVGAGALWIAAEDCEGVEVETLLRRFDELAGEVRERLGAAGGAAPAAVLADVLRERVNLRPGVGGDPHNHYLHSVMARGSAIPIACATLWIAVGRRAGIPVEGVGLPGHFVVRVGGILHDPQSDGRPLDTAAACALVGTALGSEPAELAPEWLRAAGAREMLARMSRNLRACLAATGHRGPALRAADRCVALLPTDAVERRERGLLRFRLGLAWPALRDLTAYLAAAPPDAADRDEVEKVAVRARGMLN